jgi:hypothetical protein
MKRTLCMLMLFMICILPIHVSAFEPWVYHSLPPEIQLLHLLYPENTEWFKNVYEMCSFVNENSPEHIVMTDEKKIQIGSDAIAFADTLKYFKNQEQHARFFRTCATTLTE